MPKLCHAKKVLLLKLRDERDKYVKAGGFENLTDYWETKIKPNHPNWPPLRTFRAYACDDTTQRNPIHITETPAIAVAAPGQRNGNFYDALDTTVLPDSDDLALDDGGSVASDEPALSRRDLERYCEAEGENLKGFIADAKEKTDHPKFHLFELWLLMRKCKEFDWWLQYCGYTPTSEVRTLLRRFRRDLYDRQSILKKLREQRHGYMDQPGLSIITGRFWHEDWKVVWKDLHAWHPWPKNLTFPGAKDGMGIGGENISDNAGVMYH